MNVGRNLSGLRARYVVPDDEEQKSVAGGLEMAEGKTAAEMMLDLLVERWGVRHVFGR